VEDGVTARAAHEEKLNDIYVDVSVCTTNYSHTQMLYSSTALNRVVDVHMNVLDTTQEIQEKIQEKMYGVTDQIALL
jgi:hypothetical protein